jgi:hypothetical protein
MITHNYSSLSFIYQYQIQHMVFFLFASFVTSIRPNICGADKLKELEGRAGAVVEESNNLFGSFLDI